MTLTEQEAQTYAEALVLPQYEGYCAGERFAPIFASLATPGATVLDAGSGNGRGMKALSDLGYIVHGCDLPDIGTPNVIAGVCLWRSLPSGAEYVYCTDVLEHIPPAFTMLVVQNLLDTAERGVFLSISLVHDSLGVWVGKPLHQSIRRYDEWLRDFRELATVTDARDLGTTATYFLEPRS